MGDQRLSFSFHKCLGQGGFGEVYLATLTRPGGLTKKVAVKVLKDDLRHADAAVQRLRDEGRMLAILDHPCILRVLEMTLIQGRVALVTEYVDGIDLARCCRAGRLLPASVIIGALGEVASALHCAWTTPSPETGRPLKLIHRDVKPENIRIGKHGEVKLLDFGIARTTEMFRHAKTAQGDLPFTPGYAAPEAFTKGFQGSASDIYALGVSMYRLLAGERLYEDMDLSDQVTICCLPERYTPFVRQRLTKVEAPEEILALLHDMLAYEPDRRPTASEVEERCSTIARSLPGPNHVRWARAQEFPEPTGLSEGTLTGQTVEEDLLQTRTPKTSRGVKLAPRQTDSTRGLLDSPDVPRKPGPNPRPQTSQENHPSAVADLTPPLVEIPAPPPPPPPAQPVTAQAPPPAPTGFQSVRPHTAPFPRPSPNGPPSAESIETPVGRTLSPPSEEQPALEHIEVPPPPQAPPALPELPKDAATLPEPVSTKDSLPPAGLPGPPASLPEVLSKPQSPHKAPSTVGDFDSISAPVEEQRTPPPPSFDSGATLDAWAHEEFDEEMAQLEVAKQATPKPAPPVVPQKRATPATAARIERPGAEVGPSGGSSMLRMLGVALVLGTLVGGGLVMVGGIASVIFIFLR